MTREDAIALARVYARTSAERHSYLPTTKEEAETWMPHEWVVEAIQDVNGAIAHGLL